MFQPALLCWLDDIHTIAMTPTTTVDYCHHHNFLDTNNHLSHCPQNYHSPHFQMRAWPCIVASTEGERKTEGQYKTQGTHLLVFLVSFCVVLSLLYFVLFLLLFLFLPCWLLFSLVVYALVFLLLPQFRPHWTLQATNSVIMLSSSVLFLSLWPFFSLLWC